MRLSGTLSLNSEKHLARTEGSNIYIYILFLKKDLILKKAKLL